MKQNSQALNVMNCFLHPMNKMVIAILFGVLLAMLPVATTFQYAYSESKDKQIIRNNGMSADAAWHEERPDGGTLDTYLFVTESHEGTDIYFEILVYEPDGISTGQFAYVFTTENVFDISKKLKTATLSPITVEICIFDEETGECEPASVTLEAQWTGIGEVLKIKNKSSIKAEDFKAHFKEKTLVRQATATGSLGESDLGESEFAEIRKFKTVEMIAG